MMKTYRKKYVDVLQYRHRDGSVEILEIFFDHDHGYPVQESHMIGYKAGHTGNGKCWQVMISGKKRYVYFEKNHYFVDAIVEKKEQDPYLDMPVVDDGADLSLAKIGDYLVKDEQLDKP